MNNAADAWRLVMEIIERDMTITTVNTWFDDAIPISMSLDKLTVYSPTQYHRDVINTRYKVHLRRALKELFGRDIDIEITDTLPAFDLKPQKPDIIDMNSGYTFDNFIVGRSNKYAHAAAVSVAEQPGTEYNPLFIYGESGLGKTHLLFAIANAVRKVHPEYSIIYIKGDDFINEHVESIRNKTTSEFRAKYRNCDLFLVDDIQFIARMDNVQTEFFHTFDTLSSYGKQTVITSDRPPKEMPTLTDRLRTRFEWGLLTEITRPDHETRMAIIKSKAIRTGLDLPDDLVDYLAETITNNIRQLEGAVKKIAAQSRLAGVIPENDIIAAAIRDLYKDNDERLPTPALIVSETCKFYNVEEKAIKGSSRSADIKLPRHVAMYLMRKLTNMSFEAIGREFGGKDHSTVINAVKRMEEYANAPGDIADALRDISSNINYRLEN